MTDEVLRAAPSNKLDGKIFRAGSVDISSASGKTIHRGLFPEETIISAMNAALHILYDEKMPLLIRLAIFHYAFAYIHPFYDGNGRTGRFIVSYFLAKRFHFIVALRLSYILKKNLKQCYELFKLTDAEINCGDLTPFITEFVSLIAATFDNVSDVLKRKLNRLDKLSNLLLPVVPNEPLIRKLYVLLLQTSSFLYAATDDIGEHYLTINDNGTTVYAPLVDTTDTNASDIRIRLSGTTYAPARQYVNENYDPNDPDPALLLQCTRAGTHTSYYQVGDTFDITLNGNIGSDLSADNLNMRAVIIGFDHNKDLETGGSHSTHLALCQTTSDTPVGLHQLQMNTDRTNVGGWASSYMRLFLLPNLFSALPASWQSVTGNVTKYSDNTGSQSSTSSDVTATSDKLFLPSEVEFAGVTTIGNPYEAEKQQQYSYFLSASSDTFYALKLDGTVLTTGKSVWTRSPHSTNATSFSCRTGAGNWTSVTATGTVVNTVACFAIF